MLRDGQTLRLASSDYDTILTMLQKTVPTLRSVVSHSPIEFDDLYQDTFLRIVALYPVSLTKRNPTAYVVKCIRFLTVNFLNSIRTHALSLDAPLSSDSNLTLHDVVEDHRPAARDEVLDEQRTRALYDALRRLPLEDQQYLRRVYELNGYDVLPLYPYSLNNSHKTDSAVSKHAYRCLRNDTSLKVEVFGPGAKKKREAVCDELWCPNEAVAFDSERIMFVCEVHRAK